MDKELEALELRRDVLVRTLRRNDISYRLRCELNDKLDEVCDELERRLDETGDRR